MRLVLGALFFAAQFGASVALAQTAAEREACKANFEQFCQGVEPGGGRIFQCLNEHFNELTPQCQAVVKANAPK